MKGFNGPLALLLLLGVNIGRAQSVEVSANPSNARLAVNCNSSSSSVKVRSNQSGTAVLAYLQGYNTQGLLASELAGKGSDYVIKLPKVVKPAKGFNSRKIEFTKLVARDGSEANSTLSKNLRTNMTNAGYKVVGTNNLFSGKSDVPELAVGGEITWLGSETAGPGFQAGVLIHWSVYSVDKENVVYETTTGGYSDTRNRGPYIDELVLAVQDAFNGLLYDAKFQDLAIKKSDAAAAATPSQAVVLPKPTLKKFANYSAVVKESVGSVVTIKTDFGIGSGFIVSADGNILTNHHVINGAEKIEVIFDNGFSFEAKLVRSNEERDVALIKMAGSGFKPLVLNGTDELAGTGSEVIAIGTPENIKLGQTVTKGIISGKRELEEKMFLQTDVAINSGNSGGPLINTSTGEVIGIVAAKIKAKGVEGLGFAIPIAEAITALNLKFE